MKKIIALLAVLIACNAPAQNVLLNAGFESGELAPWKVQGKIPTGSAIDAGVLHLTISEASDTPSHRMLIQKDLVMESGTKYLLSFEVKTEASNRGEMKVSIVPTINYKAGHYGLMRAENPSSEWETFEYRFRSKDIKDDDPACIKIHIGNLDGDTCFRNFVLKKVAK